MKILDKHPWLVYLLCFFIMGGPALFVWLNYDSIESDIPEKKEEQIAYISLISLIPFLVVCLSWLYIRYKKN